MRRARATVIALALAGAVAFLVAATYEVTSLGAGLTRTVRNLRGPMPPSIRPDPGPRPPTAARSEAAGGRPPVEAHFTSVSFTATEEDLGRLLQRRDTPVGGWLSHTREVACRLTDDRIRIETRNRLRLFGVTVSSYSGVSGWALAALPDGVGVKLSELRIAGLPVPGSSWLLRRFGQEHDGWIVLRPGSRATIDRIEVTDGKLTVVGRVRRAGSARGMSRLSLAEARHDGGATGG